jgi:type I restriction enzyme S subunit
MSGLKYIDEQTPTFFISSSYLEGRFDPYYYNSALKDFTDNQNFPVKKIYEVVKSFTSGFGVGRQDQSDADTGLIQIRPTNLDQYGLLKFDRNVYIPKNLIKHEGQLLEKGDVIFNNTNSQEWVGKAAYYDLDERLAFSNHITVLKADKEQIDPRYLWLILNLYQQKKIFFSICTNWNNQSGVGLELLKSLKIPVPDIKVQETIIESLQGGYKKRAELNNVCNSLLDGIDSYILNELGITLPEKDTSIEARMFQTTFQELSGRRFDPLAYQPSLLDEIGNGTYPITLLKGHVKYAFNGFAAGKSNQSELETDIIQIRPTNIDEHRFFKFERNIYISNEKREKLKNELCLANEVLFNNTNSQEQVGKTILFDLEGDYFCSNHITRIKTNLTLEPSYLTHMLNIYQKSKVFFNLCTNWNNQSGVNADVLLNLHIPLPPIEKQRELGQEANRRRFEAQRLSLEADKVLEDARAEIEQMILE